jgi:dTDP-4-amino-4,6-dideoxygalactose transaminase
LSNLNLKPLVPFYDLSRKISKYRIEINNALVKTIDSGNVVLGSEVANFEKEFSEYLGADYCVGTANGTDSIELALRAVGAELGTKVATCANAGGYSITAINCIGATPIYMDVDIHTRNITLASVQNAIMEGAEVVIATHLYGMAVVEISEISLYCKAKNVILIEDCAQAHGAEIDGKKVGTFGILSAFSFYPTKNLGALGDAGAVVTNSIDHFSRLLKLRTYGWSEKYKTDIQGGRNSRLDEIQAAILRVFLSHLEVDNAKRLEIANFYDKNIDCEDIFKPVWAEKQYVAHIYPVASKFRDAYLEKLFKAGVGYAIHYPIPDHRQQISEGKFGEMKNTETL